MSFLYVKIYYGPCNTFSTCIHKPQLLRGLRDRLQKLGFRVDLVTVKYVNYCMLEMCGQEIFRCNLKHLKFNTSPERDPVCQRAIEAVMTSAVKFRRGRAFLWFGTLINHQLFKRNKYAPKDYWPVDVDFTPLATVKECWECCYLGDKRNTAMEDKTGVYSFGDESLAWKEQTVDESCADEELASKEQTVDKSFADEGLASKEQTGDESCADEGLASKEQTNDKSCEDERLASKEETIEERCADEGIAAKEQTVDKSCADEGLALKEQTVDRSSADAD